MTPVYHITHVNNLAAMIACGEMRCVAALRRTGTGGYMDIAYGHIQDRRAKKQVPCGPGGSLCDYVPFYFAPRSPMLCTIHRGNVPGYREGQDPVVHLVAHADDFQEAGLDFVFTDGHAVMEISRYFTGVRRLKRIDWEIMEARYWHDTSDDSDRKRRRQAEFLVHQRVPWKMVREIGVLNADAERQVRSALRDARHRPVVAIRREWYY